ncbi:family 20 glycosylhydrolase [Furfurilactobacillus sp. WILCCON 0119]
MTQRMHQLFILLPIMILFLIPSRSASAAPRNGQFNGLTIDVARRYYNVDTLKALINTVAKDHGQFVQLHLTDEQSFAIENNTVGQTLDRATQKDGVWRNSTTHQRFYSKDQIATLVTYAKQQHVTLIPEIDTPAHVGGLVATLKASGQQTLAKQLTETSSDYGSEMRLTTASSTFVSQIDNEVATSFTNQANPYFHLGGDEFTSSTKANPKYVTYVNAVAKTVEQAGFMPEAWNDGFLNHDLNQFDHNIQVTYWNWTGDAHGATKQKLQRARASMPTLIHQGFKVQNDNDYYLYFNISPKNMTAKNVAYMSSDMKENWDPTIWDNDEDSSLNSLHNITGSGVGFWADDAGKISDQQIVTRSTTFLHDFFALARQPI